MLDTLRDWIFGKRREPTVEDLEDTVQRTKLSNFFPWDAYDPETKAYYNQDDTVGFMWECSPLSFAGQKTTFTLGGIFRLGLPEDSIVQFNLYTDTYIDGYLQHYKANKLRAQENDVLREATENYARYFNEGTKGMEVFLRTPLKDWRLYVSVKVPLKKDQEVNLTDLYNSVKEILSGAKLYPVDVGPDELIDWMRKLLNDKPAVNNRHYNDQVSLRKQVLMSETDVDVGMSEVRVGEKHFRCTTVKSFPKEVWAFQTNELFGGVWGKTSDANQMLTPFMYSLNIVFQDLKSHLHFKCNLVLQQQGVGSFAPSLMRRKDEYLTAVDQIEKGTPFVRIVPTLWVWGNSEREASESIVRAKRMWESQGYVMQEDKGILGPLLLASLPMGLYIKGDNIEMLERDFIAPAEAVAEVLPVQADFSGGGERPVLLFMGRKGQPTPLDIFDKAAGNYNCFVAASSGSGKSFLVNYIACNYYASGALIRIIDIGGSYKKMTRLFNARFLDFSPESDICLNPFSNVLSPDSDLPVISAIVLQMAYSSTDIIPEAAAETGMSLIKMAVKWAWDNKGADAAIDDVYEYLSRFPDHERSFDNEEGQNGRSLATLQELARLLAFNLTDFTSSGAFGKWFNGRANFDISKDEFVVLELEHLKPIKELFKVVTLQVINAVTQDLYLSDRSRPRMVIFDESWQFMKEGSQIGEVIEEGYRRARKYGGSFTIITQSVLDLKMFGAVGDVVRANSAFKFYLESSDFAKAKADKLLDYEDFGMQLLQTVQRNVPKYSEVWIDSPFGVGPTRLAVDPYSYYLYTSSPGEIAEIEKMVDEGMSYDEAIRAMVNKYKKADVVRELISRVRNYYEEFELSVQRGDNPEEALRDMNDALDIVSRQIANQEKKAA